MSDLPIYSVLPDLLAALRQASNAVLVAPPGGGKTTSVAPALLNEGWCDGQIWLLSPRRLAARAAAERMAELSGSPVGGLIGYATRMDSKTSTHTRILVLTEGIFRNRIQNDPELSGISAVLFDEVHERSLDSDFGLALALDAQGGLRPDLRLIAMSATLDGGRFSALMGNCPVIESEGRAWPLELRHVGRRGEIRVEEDMAATIRRALAEEGDGDVLAFLPGVAEIDRTAERLSGLGEGVVVHRLHGSLDAKDQRAAIRPDADKRRKVILATSIAETSLTIDGVRIVVDSGLARRPRYDRAAGVTRLVTEKASQAAVTQRAGRAARQRPGVAYRLWEGAATQGLPPFDPPEILESDLSSLLLDCALWGVMDPAQLSWLDPPPEAAKAEARTRLQALGALDETGHITSHGRAVARLPLEPRIAHMLIAAKDMGMASIAAEVAVLLGERGLGGSSADIEDRLRRFRQERGARASSAARLARRWASLVGVSEGENRDLSDHAVGRCLALAFPDRVAKRRSADGAEWASAGGRGFRLDPLSPLAREEWLAVGEVQGSASGARIISAAALDETAIAELFADQMRTQRSVRFRSDTGGVEALRQQKLGAITLSSGGDDAPDRDMVAQALLDGVRQNGLDMLPWSGNAQALRRRAAFAQSAAISDDALIDELADWLLPLLDGKRRLADVDAQALSAVLDMRLGWDGRKELDRQAPSHFTTPMGHDVAIDYEAPGGPEVEIRVQALFGLAVHPTIGPDRLPLRLSLTSPAGRPIQTTSDLPGFWAGSWADVAKEMRGRYPRHPWPDDPAQANATLRTKRATAAGKS